jgi:transposase
VELYLKVRLAVSEGMIRHRAAKHFNISRDSVAKMVSYSTPPGYQRQLPIRRPKLDAFVSTIEHWLKEDLKVPRKQRHTAKRVFDRLRDEWVKKTDVDTGKRAGLPSDVAEKMKALERENRELRQANEILRKASAYFAMAELDRPFKR